MEEIGSISGKTRAICWHPVCLGPRARGHAVEAEMPGRIDRGAETAARATGPRRADRRAGLATIVRELAGAYASGERRSTLQEMFERHLLTVLPLRSLRLHELSHAVDARLDRPLRTRDAMAFSVPTPDGVPPVVLEVSSDEGSPLDDWACQLLEGAASLAVFILEADRLRGLRAPRPGVPAGDGAAPLIGSSAQMSALRERVERVAVTDFTILIEGESGTGKELVARQIHDLSRRRTGPFVAINCAALVESLLEAELFGIEERTATGVRGRRGKFEHADGGTLFLDEVSDLSMAAQAKLLRAIQDLAVERVGGQGTRRVNTRIVAATNRPLVDLVEQGVFRADLYYRLSGVDVRVPPLRARREDIIELAGYFLARHETRGRFSLTPAAVDALVTYDWPGNVRELERLVEGAVATAESRRIGLDDLPISLRGAYGEYLMPALQRDDTMRAWGSRYARLVVDRCGGNKRRACRQLGISYHTLQAYLRYRSQEPGEAHRDRLAVAEPTPTDNGRADDRSSRVD
jgi:DNA-binding NtrC family response regulator